MRRALVLLLALVGACPGPTQKAAPVSETGGPGDDDRIARLTTELQDDILGSYERDDPPEIETGMVQVAVGGARIGVGPGDLLIGDELKRAGRRWPLDVGAGVRTEVKSKRLETHLAQDQTAAWTFDEVSWRIPMCNRIAVIPMRMTSLYAHDGDRWVVVFEHLSFGRPARPHRDGKLYGATMHSTPGNDLTDELSRVLQTGLFRQTGRDRATMSVGPESMVLGPDVDAEWHGPDVLDAVIVGGTLRTEDRRVGTIGRSAAHATMAYWIGNIDVDLAPKPGGSVGKVRMRATFVFEQRRLDEKGPSCGHDGARCRWVLVQAHLSQPMDDIELANQVFGTALLSPKPLQTSCDDGTRADLTVPPSAPQGSAAPSPP